MPLLVPPHLKYPEHILYCLQKPYLHVQVLLFGDGATHVLVYNDNKLSIYQHTRQLFVVFGKYCESGWIVTWVGLKCIFSVEFQPDYILLKRNCE